MAENKENVDPAEPKTTPGWLTTRKRKRYTPKQVYMPSFVKICSIFEVV